MGNAILSAMWKEDPEAVETMFKTIMTVNDADIPGISITWDKDHSEWRVDTDYPILTKVKRSIAKVEIEELDVTKHPDFLDMATYIVNRNAHLQSENQTLREQLKRYGIQDHWPYEKT